MALSTLEFVAEHISASSVGGLCGAGPVSASAIEAGSGTRLVEARLVGSPDIARLFLFLLDTKGTVIFQIQESQDRLLLYLYSGVSPLTVFLLSLPDPDARG